MKPKRDERKKTPEEELKARTAEMYATYEATDDERPQRRLHKTEPAPKGATTQTDNRATEEQLATLQLLLHVDADDYITEDPFTVAAKTLHPFSKLPFKKNDPRLRHALKRLKNKCPHLTTMDEDDEGLPMITLEMGKTKTPIRALIDTGASGIFMRSNLAGPLRLTSRHHPTNVTVGNDNIVHSNTRSILPITIDGETITMDAILLTNCPYDVILGTNFL